QKRLPCRRQFKTHFDKTLEDFRDKKVMEFQEASLKRISLEKDGKSKTLVLREEKKEEDKEKTKAAWASEDGTPMDHQAVSKLLSTLAFLKCQGYPDSPEKADLEKTKPLCRIRLENEGGLELFLFKGDQEEQVYGTSSMNGYVFELSRFSGKEILSNVDQLLGIEKKDPKKKE
nr:DUF4340 domain-containing protein [Desulfobacula sp.]